jgi:alpha/beta superfamily hydrolase
MDEYKVFIPSTGIQLEALLRIHEASASRRGVLVCHPHPQFGGDMHNPVVSAVVKAAFHEGYSTLRFNFRGVGESGGSYGEGIGEKDDVQAAIQFMKLKFQVPDPFMIVAGYSFGAWTGLQVAAQDPTVGALLGIAPPLGIYDFTFLKDCRKRKLFVVGDRDMFCPLPELKRWYDDLEEPKSLTVLPGADHFLTFHLPAVAEALEDFLHHPLV